MEDAWDGFDEDMLDEMGISPEDYQEYLQQYHSQSYGQTEEVFAGRQPWRKMLVDCAQPVLFAPDTQRLVTYIVALCLLQRFINNLVFLPSRVKSLTTGILGVCALYLTMDKETLLPLVGLFGVFVLIILWSAKEKRSCGVFVTLFSAAAMLTFQIHLPSKQFTKLRGALMIFVMKMVSVGVDLDASALNAVPSDAATLFGYCFDVSSVLFGPWFRFADHWTMLNQPSAILEQVKSILRGCVKLAFCLFFLVYSSCLVDWLIPDNAAYISRWLTAFRDAQSYRSSHYFVSFIAEAYVLLAGFDFGKTVVTSPLHIELPRSLVETVVHWNVPMHRWLRHYVFERVRKVGAGTAVICTYVASSFLHGLNFQLSAVLLSLGFYTYAEHVLREKLARTYNACIRARKCAPDCSHQNKKTHMVVMLVNFLFFVLAVFHLTYLGMPFVSAGDDDEHGYSWKHTWTVWRRFNFISHWVAALTLYFAWAI
uniref:Protein-serine O-palmitoleoyltransferase porcupine n=1 Tax=Plectus sambesii TaxID=2011161 RepID=A0A914VHJ0_9BILA